MSSTAHDLTVLTGLRKHGDAWQDMGLCRTQGEDLETFFSSDLVGRAKSICIRCPVIDDCRAWIMSVEDGLSATSRDGVFAALTSDERAALDPEVRRREAEAAKRRSENKPAPRPDRPQPAAAPVRPLDELKALPLDDLDLTARVHNALRRMDIHTVGDLIALTEAEVRSIRLCGAGAFAQITDRLAALGLALREPQPRVRDDLKPCGTTAAAKRHERAGEPLCAPCLAARASRAQRRREEQQDALVYAAWMRGLTDQDIAHATGFASVVVRRARARQGLQAHERQGAHAA
ncbi:WhiB family transcriptional regulator [Streptomyces sp. NBC_01216]|uniref:WhiB family transcriptional regulator n=1 Tax=Streptomyces sp. NBC_01216 TaxID=2903778 RepID=UPI002E132BEB|nr:WhiB family transcriptional regulator [Streptomyces sp. NBC_01216]